jgi:hypothetical protein
MSGRPCRLVSPISRGHSLNLLDLLNLSSAGSGKNANTKAWDTPTNDWRRGNPIPPPSIGQQSFPRWRMHEVTRTNWKGVNSDMYFGSPNSIRGNSARNGPRHSRNEKWANLEYGPSVLRIRQRYRFEDGYSVRSNQFQVFLGCMRCQDKVLHHMSMRLDSGTHYAGMCLYTAVVHTAMPSTEE